MATPPDEKVSSVTAEEGELSDEQLQVVAGGLYKRPPMVPDSAKIIEEYNKNRGNMCQGIPTLI